jgi:hypothetical protein
MKVIFSLQCGEAIVVGHRVPRSVTYNNHVRVQRKGVIYLLVSRPLSDGGASGPKCGDLGAHTRGAVVPPWDVMLARRGCALVGSGVAKGPNALLPMSQYGR